jgi:oligosaccharide repeat unit polymerase
MMAFLLFVLMGFVLLLIFVIMLKHANFGTLLFQPFPGFVLIAFTFYLYGILIAPFEVEGRTIVVLLTGLFSLTLATYPGSHISFNKYNSELSSIHPSKLREAMRKRLRNSFPFGYVVGLALTGLAAISYLRSANGFAIFAQDIDAARVLATSNGYIATVGTLLDVSAISCYAYTLTFKGQKKDVRYFIAWAIIILFLIIAFLDGSRSRPMKLFLPALIIRHFLYDTTSFKKIFVISLLGIVFVGSFAYYRAFARWGAELFVGLGHYSPDVIIFDLIQHFFLFEIYVPIFGLQAVLNAIPSISGHTYGLLHSGPLLMPLQFLGFEVPNPGDYFKSAIGGTWSGFGLAATLFSPMYSDFGYLGVILFSLVYGYGIKMAYYFTRTNAELTPYAIILYSVVFMFYINGIRSDVVSFDVYFYIFGFISIAFFRRKNFRS